MKFGKDKSGSNPNKAEESEASKPVQPQPAVVSGPVRAEQVGNPSIVPVNLLAAVEKIRSGGGVPVIITRELEKFLTEQGVFRDDMRPEEAWDKLNEIAGNAPEPEPPAAS